ncbi:2-oxo-4-hydroxy-4-carboxy--5-ureidoimidazoline (OHCU) decarboxylase [Marinobacterium lacunae]|uniref:2-oxo-4-hydroxy-4-carboxy-5-ureidoimidazoline decarboxylase n=1 Tax=Marinobacterium lacunae TaxID=1232683 RepID=A0A081FTG5_9GAMM|nr:2-oxo-4-hydroxy-4-carboxy-5-ureidoimidazoline decarboxylase [Marinobacterium lacunae]KEA61820.1 2-oxo-4-hydroxy-4-carboxy--5-ureidoimidazoline (OHCU) decarboxylase [Marinobacterium lacunae]
MTLDQFNRLSPEACAQALQNCCVSTRWIEGMLANRPFDSYEALQTTAEEVWRALSMPDYLEAFEGHPQIGDLDSLKAKYANTKQLAAGEQSGANDASNGVLEALAAGNAEYERRFGFIFIVCATGKSAEEMLGLLNERLDNDLISELAVAAGEQAKITRLRLEKLFNEERSE